MLKLYQEAKTQETERIHEDINDPMATKMVLKTWNVRCRVIVVTLILLMEEIITQIKIRNIMLRPVNLWFY